MHPFIRLYPAVLPADECAAICARFDADARVYEGRALGVPEAKRCRELVITALPDWADECRSIRDAIHRSAEQYRRDVPTFKLIHRHARDTGYQIQRYAPNGSDGFEWHADAMSRATAMRFLAFILYLNDVDEGGETEFFAQQLRVRPRAGSALWFPPGFEYMHRGVPPVSGPKYIVTSFLAYP